MTAAAGCGRGAPAASSSAAAAPPCPAGVVARGPAGPIAFTAGWVRLTLRPCPGTPGDAAAAQLEVEGADRRLLFSPGRPGGATAGVLTATADAAPGGPQAFAVSAGSSRSRDVVLAPWAVASPPPRLAGLHLAGPAARPDPRTRRRVSAERGGR